MGAEGLILRLACDPQQWKSSVLETCNLSGSALPSQRSAMHQDSIVLLDQKGRSLLPFTTNEDETHHFDQYTELDALIDAMQKTKSRAMTTAPLRNVYIKKKDGRSDT